MSQPILDAFTEKARPLLEEAVRKVAAKFPDESYPVRPPYRRAVFRRYKKLKQKLEAACAEVLEETPGEESNVVQGDIARMIGLMLREYGLRTQKKDMKPAS